LAYGSNCAPFGPRLVAYPEVHLGAHGSGRIELKEGHRIVRSGPYGWVRHPIYAGIVMAIAGSALVAGEATALLAPVVLLAAYLRKVRMEEAVLLRTFGDEYQAYRRDVKALLLFVV
jgi:protein-S-isoprenylcysteine O-methyltransferase Ste14